MKDTDNKKKSFIQFLEGVSAGMAKVWAAGMGVAVVLSTMAIMPRKKTPEGGETRD